MASNIGYWVRDMVSNIGILDNDGSALIDRESPEGREIRRLVKQAKRKIEIQRKKGIEGKGIFSLVIIPLNDLLIHFYHFLILSSNV